MDGRLLEKTKWCYFLRTDIEIYVSSQLKIGFSRGDEKPNWLLRLGVLEGENFIDPKFYLGMCFVNNSLCQQGPQVTD